MKRYLTFALTAAVVLAIAAAVMFGWHWHRQTQLERAHASAVAAARQLATNFVSISAGSVDQDIALITAGATGEFHDEFAAGSPQVREAVVANAVDSRGTVLRAGLVSGDLDSAVVLIAVDAMVKNVNAPDGRPTHYRIRMELACSSGTWLVSKLEFVG